MNLGTMQFYSAALQRHVTYSVILPDKQAGPAPVLLQLHGYSDDHTAWVKFSNLVRHAKPHPFLIVMPDGATSFYNNLNPLMRYEDFLMDDLWQHVQNTFQIRSGPWALGGLSMGGFGSMRLAAKYPDRFASVWAHSGYYPALDELHPGLAAAPDMDVYALMERLAGASTQPVITLDCGTEDRLLPQNRRLHDHLERLGVAHTYLEFPGDHDWDYWDLHVQKALEQHARVMVG